MNGITKETFLNAEDSKNRDAMLYDMLTTIHKDVKCLQKRKNRDTAVSATSGFLGGVSAVVGKWLFFKP